MAGIFASAINPVRSPFAKSRPRQVWEMLSWGSRLIVTPNDYRTHGLYLRGKTRNEAMRFLSVPRAKILMWPLNADASHFKNKLLFEARFGGLGLPVPKTLAILGATVTDVEVATMSAPKAICDYLVRAVRAGAELAIKPIDLWGGVGVSIITGIREGEFIFSDGSSRPIAQVSRELATGSWIVQDRIIQHPLLAALNESSLNTLRLGTFRRENGSVEIVFAKLRIGRAHSQLDSNSNGGFSVWIDPRTGRFSDLAYQFARYSLSPVRRHPDSGAQFSGKMYPHWESVVSTAEKFALNAGDNKFIGWDVAMTERGPIFVEGNQSWDVQLAQIGSPGILTDDFIEMYNSDGVSKISATSVPPLRPFHALSELRRSRSRR